MTRKQETAAVALRRLLLEKEAAERELARLKAGIRELRIYLSSEKFHEDTTVQVGDVFLRLDEAEFGQDS